MLPSVDLMALVAPALSERTTTPAGIEPDRFRDLLAQLTAATTGHEAADDGVEEEQHREPDATTLLADLSTLAAPTAVPPPGPEPAATTPVPVASRDDRQDHPAATDIGRWTAVSAETVAPPPLVVSLPTPGDGTVGLEPAGSPAATAAEPALATSPGAGLPHEPAVRTALPGGEAPAVAAVADPGPAPVSPTTPDPAERPDRGAAPVAMPRPSTPAPPTASPPTAVHPDTVVQTPTAAVAERATAAVADSPLPDGLRDIPPQADLQRSPSRELDRPASSTAGPDRRTPITATTEAEAAVPAPGAAPTLVTGVAPVAAPAVVAGPSPVPGPATVDGAGLARLVEQSGGELRSLHPAGGAHRMVVRLDPPELGRVTVELVTRGEVVHVVMRAELGAALDVLDAQRAQIRDGLERQGLTLGRFDVRPDGRDSHDRDRPHRQRSSSPAGQTGPLFDPEPLSAPSIGGLFL